MTISAYQISSVIKTYTNNMKVKAVTTEKDSAKKVYNYEDTVTISEEAMKKMLYDRIEEQMTGRLKRYE